MGEIEGLSVVVMVEGTVGDIVGEALEPPTTLGLAVSVSEGLPDAASLSDDGLRVASSAFDGLAVESTGSEGLDVPSDIAVDGAIVSPAGLSVTTSS